MSGAVQDGGPAFPVPGLHHDEDFNGMSLRDYLAVHADIGDVDGLTGAGGVALLNRPMPLWKDDPVATLRWWADYRAALRYMEADAMLAARKTR